MKKLTAGIFAGILTIVAVNAANAEIASKGYVDAINTAIRNTDVMKSGITSEKVEQYDALVYGSDSVASQIADALGADFPENSDVITELNKKQDKLGAANVKVSETKGSGNVVTAVSAADGVVTIEKETTLGALATLNGECTKMGNKCVLTYGSDGYKWEIVERAASELGAE